MRKRCFLWTVVVLLSLSFWMTGPPAQALVHYQWAVREVSFTHHSGSPVGIAVDSGNNFVVSGDGYYRQPDMEFLTFKYASDGTRLWMANYNPVAHGQYESANDFKLDAQGNSYVTGNYILARDNDDIITLKYNPLGQLLWEARYDGPLNSADHVAAMAVDDAGNVCLTGQTFNAGTSWDVTTVKYNSEGVLQWARSYDLATNFEVGYCIACDHDGCVYVGGCSETPPGPLDHLDFLILKYSPSGQLLWDVQYNGPGNGDDICYGLFLDSQANVYVAGNSAGLGTSDDVAIQKYDSSGVLLWTVRYDNPEHDQDVYEGFALDQDANVLILMKYFAIGTNPRLLQKYSSDGVLSWEQYIPTDFHWGAFNGKVAVDPGGGIYIAGHMEEDNEELADAAALKYDAQGNFEWLTRYDRSANEYARYIAVDAQGGIGLAGLIAYPPEGGSDFLTIKYQQSPGTVTAQMIPDITPVTIPAAGGTFSYTLQTLNTTGAALPLDRWNNAIYPDGETLTILGPWPMTLPTDSGSVPLTQSVPGRAPAGSYHYILYMGEYPDIIWATDTLVVTKLTTGDGLGVEDWTCSDEPVGAGFITPREISLSVSPNPFNPTTVFSFELPKASFVKLAVYDVSGRLVATLVDGWREAGKHEMTFDGSGMPSGVYLYRLKAGEFDASDKMLLLK
jgi:hypothetical protein